MKHSTWKAFAYVRFGSKADICAATSHVRFTPNSDRESEIPQKVMSALLPKADMCGATSDVRYGPKADIVLKTRDANDAGERPFAKLVKQCRPL
jgi:hypothetical protein